MVDIDTLQLRESAREFKLQSANYLETITNTFYRLSRVNSTDNGWSGAAATRFISIANLDATQYKMFGKCLKSYGTYLENSADTIDKLCRKIKYRR